MCVQLQKHYAHAHQHGRLVSNRVLHSYRNINQLPLSTSKSKANLRCWQVQPRYGGRCLYGHGKGRRL